MTVSFQHGLFEMSSTVRPSAASLSWTKRLNDQGFGRIVGDVGGAAAVVVRVVEIDVLRQHAAVVLAIDVLALEHLLEASETVEPRRVLRQRRVGDLGVIRREHVIAVVADDLFHRHVGVLARTGRFDAERLVDEGELEAVAEVHERLAVAIQVEVNPSVLVVVVRFG